MNRSEQPPLSGERVLATAERGAAAVELSLLVPALALMIGLIVAGGRIWFAQTTVEEAALAAARAASLARSADTAVHAGRHAGVQSLGTAGLHCAERSVAVRVDGFSVPVGVPAAVQATAVCSVALSDVALPGLPGHLRIVASRSVALDTYRGR